MTFLFNDVVFLLKALRDLIANGKFMPGRWLTVAGDDNGPVPFRQDHKTDSFDWKFGEMVFNFTENNRLDFGFFCSFLHAEPPFTGWRLA